MRDSFKAVLVMTLVVCVSMLVGCEWNSGSDADLGTGIGTNLSGSYDVEGGGLVVTSNGDDTDEVSVSVGTGDGATTDFSTVVAASAALPIIEGSVTVQAVVNVSGDIEYFIESGLPGQLESNMGGLGTVNHDTGELIVEFASAPVANTDVVLKAIAATTANLIVFFIFSPQSNIKILR